MNLMSLIQPTAKPAAQLFDSVETYDEKIADAEARLAQLNATKASHDLDAIKAEAERISEMITEVESLKRSVTIAAPTTRDDFKAIDNKLRDIERSIAESRASATVSTDAIEPKIAGLKDLRQQREAQAKRLRSAWTMNRLTKDMIEFDKLTMRRPLPGLYSQGGAPGLPYVDEQRYQHLRAKLIEQERANVKRWAEENEVVKVVCKLAHVSYEGIDDSVRHTVYCRAMRDGSTDDSAGVLISYGYDLDSTAEAFKKSGIHIGRGHGQTAYIAIDSKGRMRRELMITKPGALFHLDLHRDGGVIVAD